MKIVFMGTPDFAVATFEGLLRTKSEICLAVTRPDSLKGRGLKPSPSAVKKLALKEKIDVVTPVKIKTSDFINKLKDIKPDLFVVSAYGKIIPKVILDIPKLYSINVHASLLPKYRGAAPINWAIIKGEEKTGISVIRMNEKMDAGEIMIKEEISIEKDENASSLHDKLAVMGKRLIAEAIEKISGNKATFEVQDESKATFAPMLKKSDGLIDWTMESADIHNFVRGMNPWPGSFTHLKGKTVKIYKTQTVDDKFDFSFKKCVPGQIIGLFGDYLAVRTRDTCILVKELQEESRKKLNAKEFTSGHENLTGEVFKNRL